MRKLYFNIINHLFGWMFTKEKSKEQATIEILDLIKFDGFKERSIEKQLELIESVKTSIYNHIFDENKRANTVVRLTNAYIKKDVENIVVNDVDIFEAKSVSIVEMVK